MIPCRNADGERQRQATEHECDGTGALGGREQRGGELAVTKSTRTHHLRILRDAGVISMRAEATRRITTLRRDDLDARYPGLLDGVLSASH